MATFPQSLTTERLHLRRLAVDDAEAVFAYASDPDVARYMTFPCATSVEDAIPYLTSIQGSMDADREFHWAIERKETASLIGVVSARRDHGFNLGYVLNRTHWGHSYMPEAVRAVIDWGFNVDSVWRVWATCDVENEKSATVMRKAGMTEEGILRRWEMHPNIDAEPRDALVFGITR